MKVRGDKGTPASTSPQYSEVRGCLNKFHSVRLILLVTLKKKVDLIFAKYICFFILFYQRVDIKRLVFDQCLQ